MTGDETPPPRPDRPDRRALGFLTAKLYAEADRAGVSRDLADAAAEHVYRTRHDVAAAFWTVLDAALAACGCPPTSARS